MSYNDVNGWSDQKISDEISLRGRKKLALQGEIKNSNDRVRVLENSIRNHISEVKSITVAKMGPYKTKLMGLKQQISDNQRLIDQYQMEIESINKFSKTESDTLKSVQEKIVTFKKEEEVLDYEINDLEIRRRMSRKK